MTSNPYPNPPAIPDYISGHYRWAYLWKPGVWFFDHLPVINCIVFGQYQRLVSTTLRHFADPGQAGHTLLVASAYGNLVPSLAQRLQGNQLSLIDVAPIQLRLAAEKLAQAGLSDRAELHCMNAEQMDFADDAFDSSLMFMLLNEMPAASRNRVLREAIRTLRPGGQLVMTEYGSLTGHHFLHRSAFWRWLVTRVEPHLPEFWRANLQNTVVEAARAEGKSARLTDTDLVFDGFYRVKRFVIEKDEG